MLTSGPTVVQSLDDWTTIHHWLASVFVVIIQRVGGIVKIVQTSTLTIAKPKQQSAAAHSVALIELACLLAG